MRKTPEQKLEELQASKSKLNARISAERAKLRKKQRKDETRLKVIIGAVVLEHMARDENFHDGVNTILKHRVIRELDKDFLAKNLPPYIDERRNKPDK